MSKKVYVPRPAAQHLVRSALTTALYARLKRNPGMIAMMVSFGLPRGPGQYSYPAVCDTDAIKYFLGELAKEGHTFAGTPEELTCVYSAFRGAIAHLDHPELSSRALKAPTVKKVAANMGDRLDATQFDTGTLKAELAHKLEVVTALDEELETVRQTQAELAEMEARCRDRAKELQLIS